MQRLKSVGEGRRGKERQVENIRVIREEGAGLRGGTSENTRGGNLENKKESTDHETRRDKLEQKQANTA